MTAATVATLAEVQWLYKPSSNSSVSDGRQGPVSWEVVAAMSDDTLVCRASTAPLKWESLADIKKKKRKRGKKKPPNSSVYVSWGRDPKTQQFADISKDELVAHFKPYGIIKMDDKDEPMVRVYEDATGACKGDAIVHFLQPISANTAIENLNEAPIRPGLNLRVEKAQFNPSGGAEKKPKLLPAQAAVNRRVKLAKMQNLTGWDDEVTSGLRIVVLKHMFHPSEAVDDPSFYSDLENDVMLECEKIGGPIDKLTVFRGSPIGAVCVKFRECSGAERCIETMNGRWFAERRVECDWFDGVTNYKVEETAEQEKARIEKFGEWLEDS